MTLFSTLNLLQTQFQQQIDKLQHVFNIYFKIWNTIRVLFEIVLKTVDKKCKFNINIFIRKSF